jgi:hypothetical protein
MMGRYYESLMMSGMSFVRTSLAAVALLHGAALLILASEQCAAQERGSETRLFGVSGRGTRFVYVFDRSLSMKGNPLATAKQELRASLSRLQRVNQFQIIFYNENPRLMTVGGGPQMAFADENGLSQAESFITSVTAAGGTDHVQALKLALRMSPDVIFFLTDADDPQLSPAELDQIRRANAGAVINAIEFKSGPDQGKGGFLRKLAEQNRGEYKYVDVTELSAAR